jgi:hypothetical protein
MQLLAKVGGGDHIEATLRAQDNRAGVRRPRRPFHCCLPFLPLLGSCLARPSKPTCRPINAQIVLSSGGHPPALLASSPGHGKTEVTQLATAGFPVGILSDGDFSSATTIVAPDSQLLLYSDGAYELPTPDDSTWPLSDWSG